MNDKAKSFLYFLLLVVSLVLYYNTEGDEFSQTTQVVNNNIEQVSSPEALN